MKKIAPEVKLKLTNNFIKRYEAILEKVVEVQTLKKKLYNYENGERESIECMLFERAFEQICKTSIFRLKMRAIKQKEILNRYLKRNGQDEKIEESIY